MYLMTIPGKPVSKARPRISKRGFMYTDKKTSDYEKKIKSYAKDICKTPYTCPVSVHIIFRYKKPKTSKDKGIFKTTRPDLDNLIKSITDALNGIAYLDDSQICIIWSCKQYIPDESNVEISVKPIVTP